ncbi:MAG: 50S ribosomal protein L1 [Myxococcaceae bacterium]|nr:50S ribosomal protein L1 [Myxococcaceae bacterium]
MASTQSGKKFKAAAALVDRNKRYSTQEAFKLLKDTVEKRATKFDQTVDVAMNLGVDPKHADQMVRGAVVLPHGLGKTVRVAVFAKGEKATEAANAGADVVGAEDLAKRIEEGFMDFDTVIATPDMMGVVGRLGRVLGPRGLMPNPKTGTVTMDVTRAISDAKGGKVEFRVEKSGIVHAPVGKASFAPEKLAENFNTLVDMVMKLKPSTAKGVYLKALTISTTMGPGIKIDTNEITARNK